MKNKLFLLLLTSFIYAQNDTIWITNKGELASKNSAESYRIIKKIAPLSFQISDYNLKNILVLSQKCSVDENKLVTGTFSKFYNNGKIKMEGTILKGVLDGSLFTYLNEDTKNEAIYKNGQMIEGKTLVEQDYPDGCLREIIYKNGAEILDKYYNKNNRNSGIEIIEKTKSISYHNNKIIGQGVFSESGNDVSGIFGKYYKNKNGIYLNSVDFFNKKSEKYKTTLYHENGNIRQENNLGFNENIESTNYFDEKGQKIGTLNCDLNQTYERQYDGQFIEFDFENKIIVKKNYQKGQLVNIMEYEDGIKTKLIKFNDSGYRLYEENYDQKGIIESKLSYSDYNNQPENGTEYKDYYVTEYKNGKTVSRKQFYKSGKLFSDFINNNVFYFGEKGVKIGTLNYGKTAIEANTNTFEQADYDYPYQGIEYQCADGALFGYTKYSKGQIIEKGNFNSNGKLVAKEIFYANSYFQREKIFYYENGLKKILKLCSPNDGTETKATYYNKNGKQISDYDFITKTGTLIYYNDSDDIFEETKYLKGKIILNKKYIETYNENGFVNKLDFFETTFYKD